MVYFDLAFMRDLVSKSGCFVETSTSTKVYRNERLAIRFRDSLALFPLKLKILGQTLCPHLGPKGTIPHEEISLSTIWPLREQLLSYMRQDVLLLGGIMLKAQSLCWERRRHRKCADCFLTCTNDLSQKLL